MGAGVLDNDALSGADGARARFAGWSPFAARMALAALALVLLAAALVPLRPPEAPVPVAASPQPASAAAEAPSDKDIDLYRRAVERVRGGEDYYAFILAEQRARDYPVNPGLAVRLPTLARAQALLGDGGTRIAGLALIAGILVAWWVKLASLGVDGRTRRLAMAALFAGASFLANPHYLPLHEVWAGGLVLLSLGLHRTDGERRWVGAVMAGALAVLLRELALPFVLLMAAEALRRRHWREGAGWVAVTALFGAYLAWHLAQVAPQILPTDPQAPSWFAGRGLAGSLSNLVLSSNLHLLPHAVAGPVVVLMAFGWLGLPGRGGTTGFLLALGYALAFAIAGRWDNFYWGAVVAPTLFAGLVLVPRALAGLVAAARLPGIRAARAQAPAPAVAVN